MICDHSISPNTPACMENSSRRQSWRSSWRIRKHSWRPVEHSGRIAPTRSTRGSNLGRITELLVVVVLNIIHSKNPDIKQKSQLKHNRCITWPALLRGVNNCVRMQFLKLFSTLTRSDCEENNVQQVNGNVSNFQPVCKILKQSGIRMSQIYLTRSSCYCLHGPHLHFVRHYNLPVFLDTID